MEPKLKVLAIDDNKDNLTVLRAVMKDYLPDAQVLTATSGAEGLVLARREDPDVALLDISMPGMDGFEVCRQMKADEALSAIPVVFLTAVRTDASARIHALELGAEGFLARPMDEFALTAQVRAMTKLKAATMRRRREKDALAHLVRERTHELEAQRDQLQALLSAVPTAIVVLDANERVTLANPGAGKLFGTQAASLVGRDLEGVLRCASPPENPCGCDNLRAAVVEALKGRSVRDHEIEAELEKGAGPRQLLCNAEPLAVNGGAGVVLVLRDISELRRVQREQHEVQAKLAQSDRLMNMGLLAASVAHEINNPLSFTLHNVETLAEDLPRVATCMRRCQEAFERELGPGAMKAALGSDVEELGPAFLDDAVARLKEAHVGTQRIRRITRGLSTFARVEGTAPEPVDVQTSLEHALTLAMNEIKHRARVVKDLAPVPQVLGSEGKLAQVLLNLIVNAAHAIEEGRLSENEIRVRTRDERGTVVVEVADTGKGIAPEYRPQLFRPFFTTKGIGIGSGLGLWISRNIVEELGGTLDFESEVGKGTCFFVRLPAMTQHQRAARESAVPEPASQTQAAPRGRVLVVDDEPGVRTLLARIIAMGHDVVTATCAEEAQQLLEQPARFDVVVCDLMMPGLSGMELHSWLAAREPALAARLVFVTGGVFSRAAADYLEHVANVRIDKPFEPKAVRQVVGDLVRQAHEAAAGAARPA